MHWYDHLRKGSLWLAWPYFTVPTARITVILIIGAVGVRWATESAPVVPLLIARRLADQKLSLVSNHELLVVVAHVIAQLAAHITSTSTATMVILAAATVATALTRFILEHVVCLGRSTADSFVQGRR